MMDEAVRLALIETGIRPRYFEAKLMVPADLDMVDGGDGAILQGKTGRGKTYRASAISLEMFKQGHTVIFRLAREIMRRIRSTYAKDSEEKERDVLNELCGAKLLVIDDLGKESGEEASAFVLSALHEILTRRLDAFLPTIVTTELSPEEIKERYGEAIASRLSLLHVVLIEGEDRRKP